MSSTTTIEDVKGQEISIKLLYNPLLSSSESLDEIPSIPSSENHKMLLYQQGLYDPGSGEICTKYIPQSDSTVLRHPYYNYPRIRDPGVLEALFQPEHRRIYSLDGQELYLDLCEEMKVIPVRSFHRGLLEEAIDLKYYGVNPKGIRAMSIALTFNRNVRRLDLTSNFLNDDACYHLGQLLGENMVLQELRLSGCKLQPDGIRRLVVYLAARSLEELDLSRNDLGDEGFQHLADQLLKGAVIRRLNLSHNELTSASAATFAASIEGNKTMSHLDLSWNKMSSLKGVVELLGQLSESKVLVELNMSWNGLKISGVFKKLLTVQTLRILDVSNNRLGRPAARVISNNVHFATNLHTLDLSFNPIPAEGALLLINMLRSRSVKLVNLFMDNVEVNKEFMQELNGVLKLSFRANCKITHGNVKHNYTLSEPDIREILLKRIDFVTSRGRKRDALDIAIYFLKKIETCDYIQPRNFTRELKLAGVLVDEDLVLGLMDTFPGPRLEKGDKTIDLHGIVDMVHRLWPDKKPPVEPPPQSRKSLHAKLTKKKKK